MESIPHIYRRAVFWLRATPVRERNHALHSDMDRVNSPVENPSCVL